MPFPNLKFSATLPTLSVRHPDLLIAPGSIVTPKRSSRRNNALATHPFKCLSLSLSHSPRLILPQNGGAAPYLARNNLQFDYITENSRALRSNTYIHERARERVEKVRVGHCSCREPRRGRRPLSQPPAARSLLVYVDPRFGRKRSAQEATQTAAYRACEYNSLRYVYIRVARSQLTRESSEPLGGTELSRLHVDDDFTVRYARSSWDVGALRVTLNYGQTGLWSRGYVCASGR